MLLFPLISPAQLPHLQAAVSEGPQDRATASTVSLARHDASHMQTLTSDASYCSWGEEAFRLFLVAMVTGLECHYGEGPLEFA
jgi:hypothetical protein